MWRIVGLALVLVTSAFLVRASTTAAQIPESAVGTISGTAYRLVDQTVVDGLVVEENLEAITDGQIAIPELGLDMPLPEDGEFDLRDLPASAKPENPTRVTVIFTAPGLGSFTFLNVPIVPWMNPVLTPVLIDEPRVDDLSRASRLEQSVPQGSHSPPVPAGEPQRGTVETAGVGCSPWFDTNKYPPQSIRVWENYHHENLHGPQDDEVHIVDFNFYVRHVLPMEWAEEPWDWHPQALRAGAMAVKMFGWYQTLHWQGSAHNGACWDVNSSTDDQVFDPYFSTPQTDAAVDETWNFYMVVGEDDVLETFYKAGFMTDACGEWYGGPAPGDDMSQWGSQACALDGLAWPYILATYYFPPPVSWQLVQAPAAPAVSIAPYTNTEVRLQWAGQPGLAYFLCKDSDFMSSFELSPCTYIGLGNSSVTTAVPSGYDVKRYYKILVCGEYCAAPRGGGLVAREWAGSGMAFYGTAYYVWPYATAVVAGRNISPFWTTGIILSDGAAGYGHVPKWWCPTVSPSSNCGPAGWVSGNPWVTISEYIVPIKFWNGYLRLIRNPIGD